MMATDIWGAIVKAAWEGRPSRYEIERDDGRVEALASAEHYLTAPRLKGEDELLSRLRGPVLDLAAGAGAYALYLQERGLDVTAADSSPAALEVCRARGCRTVAEMDLRTLDLAPASFGSILVMGNTLGLHQTPETFPGFLQDLRRAVRPGGHLLFTMIDPLDTTNELHLRYHQRNRERGLPPGLVRIRVRCEGLVEDWTSLWMLTEGELRTAVVDAGWTPCEERRQGAWRAVLLEGLTTS